MPQGALSLEAADAYCRELVRHYENFTVASRLSPRSLRRDLTRVYAFCRYTDDLGDESGDRAVAMRRLRRWRDETRESFEHDERTHPVLLALTDTVHRYGLEEQPFIDLIDANIQDQRIDTYENWPALRQYCMLSAAPVGRIVLRLFDITRPGSSTPQRRRLHRPPTRQLRPGRLSRQKTRPHISIAERHPQPRNRPGNSLHVRARTRVTRVRRGTRSDGPAPPSRATSPIPPRRHRHPRRNSLGRLPHDDDRPKVDRGMRVRIVGEALATVTSVRRQDATRTRVEGGDGRSANLGASEERENLFARRASGQAEHIVRLPPRPAPQSAAKVPAGDHNA